MLRHVVLLRLVDDVDDDVVERLAAALRELPSSVPSIRSYRVGVDLVLADDNAHLSVIAHFDDEEGYRRYRDHPAHVAVIENHLRPVLAARMATQSAVADDDVAST